MALTVLVKTLFKNAGQYFLMQLRCDTSPHQKSTCSHNLAQGVTAPLWTTSLTYIVLVATLVIAILLPFDAQLSRAMVNTSSPLIGTLRSITQLGLTGLYLALFAGLWLVCLGINHITKNYKTRGLVFCISQQCLFAVAALLASGVLVNIIKHVIGRARPSLIDSVGAYYFSPMSFGYSFVSFPSGHSSTAGVLAVLLSLWLPRFKVPIFIVCALVAISRVAVKAHYPSDVLAGFIIGFIVTVVLARYLSQRNLFFKTTNGKLLPDIKYNKNMGL